ncbi:mediator complex, subunit Med11 [Lasiosphaeria hispida]|uniref:Mediator of RNA polymerase II transcription subunit 11 n=1 Tax=Lasiosphaeria hispida TaxID=260671 RepID=A0AAJ0HR76_9PEZI|nr:mediator complex, subunit Med11 [Lasiosphaeria hispida]
MNSQPLDPNGGAGIDIHEPFTTAERIQQLSEIDTDIASLLQHTSDALRSIAKPPESESSPNSENSPLAMTSAIAAITNFKDIQNDFINTLDRIDKQLKRQIYALEEAGIITLRASDQQAGAEGGGAAGGGDGGGGGRAKEIVARLDPDGVGRYGSLDVGQLNMASSTVERDMESELWAKARGQLSNVAAERASGADRMQE